MPFVPLKLDLVDFGLRGPRGAQDVLAGVAQNLRRLASLIARPPPSGSEYRVAFELLEGLKTCGIKPTVFNEMAFIAAAAADGPLSRRDGGLFGWRTQAGVGWPVGQGAIFPHSRMIGWRDKMLFLT